MHTVSTARRNEMETEPCCEEHKDPTEIRRGLPETPDSHVGLPGSAAEGDEVFGGETESPSAGTKDASESGQQGAGRGNKEQRKLKKTNSWKMVRFQDPSMDDDVSERDSAAEGLFPAHAAEEWTASTFQELFVAEDWQEITGEDRGGED